MRATCQEFSSSRFPELNQWLDDLKGFHEISLEHIHWAQLCQLCTRIQRGYYFASFLFLLFSPPIHPALLTKDQFSHHRQPGKWLFPNLDYGKNLIPFEIQIYFSSLQNMDEKQFLICQVQQQEG